MELMRSQLKDKVVKIFNFAMLVFLISFVLGFAVGFKTCRYIVDTRMKESVSVGGFVYEGKVYEIKERVINK